MLLIEDSRMFSTAIRYRLERELGLEITHCANMVALRRELGDDGHDFVLTVLDLNLPDGPNCEALDYVLARGVPPLVFTGSSGEATREAILARGVLDYVVKDNPSAIQQLIAAVDRVLTSGKTRVLIVDSDRGSRDSLTADMRKQQYMVEACATGGEALDALDLNGDIDLVLCDMALSDMDGLTLLSEIQKRHGDEHVRVVGLSSAVDRMIAARFLGAGGDEYIQKPFLQEEFNSRIFHVAAIQKRIQALHHLAARDYLTDIYNRRYFFEAGPRLVDQALRRDVPMSIAILDIDHFKRLNDTYGHEVGDVVLKTIARRLKRQVAGRHLLARLGGEEFGIIFHGLDVEATIECCDALRLDLSATPIDADGEPLTVTVSVGVAAIAGKEAFDNYLNAADQFLYMAKHAGRNRVFSELSLLTALAG